MISKTELYRQSRETYEHIQLIRNYHHWPQWIGLKQHEKQNIFHVFTLHNESHLGDWIVGYINNALDDRDICNAQPDNLWFDWHFKDLDIRYYELTTRHQHYMSTLKQLWLSGYMRFSIIHRTVKLIITQEYEITHDTPPLDSPIATHAKQRKSKAISQTKRNHTRVT